MGMKMKILEEALTKYIKNSGNKPYAFICNKKTREKLVSKMEESSTLVEIHLKDQNKYVKYMPPKQLFFKDIPVFTEEAVPEDKIYIIDEETYLKIKKTKKHLWEKDIKIKEKIMQEIEYEDGTKTKERFDSLLEAMDDAKEKVIKKKVKKITITKMIPKKKK